MVHPAPEQTVSDAYQALDPPQFIELADACRAIAELLSKRRRGSCLII